MYSLNGSEIYTKKYSHNQNIGTSTITHNDALSQTLLSLKKGKTEFSNTGKCIENMNSSDLNIMKSYTRNRRDNDISGIELGTSSCKYRSISTKRVSRTDRRDGAKLRGHKNPAAVAENLGLEQNTEGFNAFINLQKKYNRLKRHYRKERKFYRGKKFPLILSLDKNKEHVYKLK